MPGGQRTRLVHACCLRHSQSLRKVSYPPEQTREGGQGGPPSACSASSSTTGACGTLQIPVCCVRTRCMFHASAIAVLMRLRAICQVPKCARSFELTGVSSSLVRFESVIWGCRARCGSLTTGPVRSRWG